MNIQDFVFKEIYSNSISAGVPDDLARCAAETGVEKWKKNRFTGKVIELIAGEVAATKKLYGVKK